MEVGTQKIHTYQKESAMSRVPKFTDADIARARRYAEAVPPPDLDPRIETLVHELIGRVADKWTMLILEVLSDHGCLRFTRIADHLPGISQKMLTQTLRQMERDGLVHRTVYPVVPPRVEYELTGLGLGLGAAFCGVWVWAAENLDAVSRARLRFDEQKLVEGQSARG